MSPIGFENMPWSLGPSTEPWGTSIVSARESDKAEPMATCCDLLLRYDFIHANADQDIPKVYSNCWYKIP